MVKMADFDFNTCFSAAQYFKDGDLIVPVVHLDDLIKAKKYSGRNKDLDDLEHLSLSV